MKEFNYIIIGGGCAGKQEWLNKKVPYNKGK